MATKRKKVTKKENQKLSAEESNLSANMLLLVYFSLFMLMALNFYMQYRG